MLGRMRWVTFLILLYFATAAQTARLGGIPQAPGGGGRGEQYWPYIEFLPLLAVFYALYAAEASAPLAALFCGLAYDLATPDYDYVGTNLIPLGLVGWLIVRIRLSIFREHFISQVVMTLVGILLFAVLSVAFRRVIGAPLHGGSMMAHLGVHAGNALYTAIVAPVLFMLLFRRQQLLGFTTHGPRVRQHG